MEQDTPNINASFSYIPQEAFYSCPDSTHAVLNPTLLQDDRDERLKTAIAEMKIGQRLHDELKRQGRSVTWLAQQLGMERPSLYYTFRQNSIDMALLLRISFCLNHNFLLDVVDIFKAYGL